VCIDWLRLVCRVCVTSNYKNYDWSVSKDFKEGISGHNLDAVQVANAPTLNGFTLYHRLCLLLHNRHPRSVLFEYHNSWLCGLPWEHASCERLSVRALLIKNATKSVSLTQVLPCCCIFSHLYKVTQNTCWTTPLQNVTGLLRICKRRSIVWLQDMLSHAEPNTKSYAYWTVHHFDIWIKVDQLDDTCFIIYCSTCFRR